MNEQNILVVGIEQTNGSINWDVFNKHEKIQYRLFFCLVNKHHNLIAEYTSKNIAVYTIVGRFLVRKVIRKNKSKKNSEKNFEINWTTKTFRCFSLIYKILEIPSGILMHFTWALKWNRDWKTKNKKKYLLFDFVKKSWHT